MMDSRWRIVLLVLCACLSLGYGSHFRGAIIMYETVDYDNTNASAVQNGIRTRVIYRIGWRRSYNDGTYCDDNIIKDGSKLLGEGSASLVCRTGCSGNLADMTFFCTDFNEIEDWSFGENTVDNVFPYGGDGIVEASFTSSAWINLVVGGSRWELRLSLNQTKMIRERGGNASPLSKMAPILRLQHGCNHTIEIPVEDADADDIRCRWASSSRGECGGVCETFPGAVLDERKCELTYTADRAIGYYAVALQIEDFLDQLDTVPFSSVPLQFLVLVYSSSELCNSKPKFVEPPTRDKESCVGIPPSGTFSEQIVAEAGGEGLSIVDIGTQSPPGMTKSSLGVYDSNKWYVNITWTPTEQQYGPNLFCYLAKDSSDQTSDQTCITLLGGVTPPRIRPGTMQPTGKIFPDHPEWEIEFDRPIFRPTQPSYITFTEASDDGVAFIIDPSTTPAVIFPDPQVSNILKFQTNYKFTERAHYYITLSHGVTAGKEFCGPESIEETSDQFWKILIRDVTPPQITWNKRPSYSNGTVALSWSYDENATTACVLQSPGQSPTSVSCDLTYTAQGLAEGYHTVFIQASDDESNSQQYSTRFWVDLTNPVTRILNNPGSFSNMTKWTFALGCTDRTACVYKCRSHQSDQAPGDYDDCTTSYTIDGLVEADYVFSAYATDAVGNIGAEVSVQWTVDVQPPQIQSVDNKTVMCGDSTSPAVLGYPTVSDNKDANPSKTYSDIAVAGCVTKRIWLAIDEAGNLASYTQLISFSNAVAPVATGDNPLYVPCGNTDDILFNPANIESVLNITHVCDRNMSISFSDSRQVDECGIVLTRTWTVTDDCGQITTYSQDIQVLRQTYPISPEISEVNVDINAELEWPAYPGANQHNVYIWHYGRTKPTVPIETGLVRRTYYPSNSYPPNTRVLWQIEYLSTAADGSIKTIPGPFWGFTTKAFPDLTITNVQIPTDAYSGSSFTMSWRVENIGNVTTAAASRFWYDAIYLTLNSEVTNEAPKFIRQEYFLDANDGYMAEADVQLNDDQIGNYYVTVITDIYSYIRDDFDRPNNKLRADAPLNIELTPPPNLVVTEVYTLGTSISGQDTIIKYTVENSAFGITGSMNWVDTILLSVDSVLDQNDMFLIQEEHTGALISNAKYENTVILRIPNGIYGIFQIIVITDADDDVYEHANENDNTKAGEIEVVLSPTPDFIVKSFFVPDTAKTGNVMDIQYTVENIGAGSPFERWWTDKVLFVSSNDGQIYFSKTRTFSRDMPPSGSYMTQIQYSVPPELPSGSYNLSIHTDAGNNILEFEADNNNFRSTLISIQQELPDLTLIAENAVYDIDENATGTYLNLNITVLNWGLGSLTSVTTEDVIFLSAQTLTSPGQLSPIFTYSGVRDIPAAGSYTIDTPYGIAIPPVYTGILYVYIYLDINNFILESYEGNNFIQLGTISVSERAADLVIPSADIGTSSTLAGTNLTVTWTVRNIGMIASSSTKWEDAIYLSRDMAKGQALHRRDVTRLTPFLPNMDYSQSAVIHIPLTAAGPLGIIIVTGERQNGYEKNLSNNVKTINLMVFAPPTPDIVVQNVIHTLLPTPSVGVRIIKVNCTVRNIGNAMQRHIWSDGMQLRRVDNAQGVSSLRVIEEQDRRLLSSETYTIIKLISIPQHIYGFHELIMSLDLFDDIKELNGENNNEWILAESILIAQSARAMLSVDVITSNVPNLANGGDKFNIPYTVTNTQGADLPLTAWIDAFFLYETSGASRKQVSVLGIRVGQKLQNHQLAIGDSYSSSVDIRIPHGIMGSYYLYIIPDVNNKLELSQYLPYHVVNPLDISEGLLPDYIISLITVEESAQSGQSIDITFEVHNIGEGSSDNIWYDALYLSEDIHRDPFDRPLDASSRPNAISKNQKYTKTVEVFIPFDLTASQYYIIALTNSDQTTLESTYTNNEDRQVISIISSPAVDLVTLDVQASANQATPNQELTFTWDILNNGSLATFGYKCDTVYLSTDATWHITDPAITQSMCNRFELSAKDGPTDSQTYSTDALIPNLADGNYKVIARSRNSIGDYNPDNNIGVSENNVTVSIPSMAIPDTKTFTVTENSEFVLKIVDIPIGIALLVILETPYKLAQHMLYLKQETTPKQYDYDYKSEEPLDTEQFVISSMAKHSQYYLLVETIGSGSTSYDITIETREAKFELISVFPPDITPQDTATLKLRGFLFGFNMRACIKHSVSQDQICSEQIYRFGPSLAYATFDVDGTDAGVYSVYLIDRDTGVEVGLSSALTITIGTPGKLIFDAAMPGTLRAGNEGLVVLNMHNAGNNDIMYPIIAVQLTGGAATVNIADTDDLLSPLSKYIFIPFVKDQPISVIPPKANRQFKIYIKSEDVGQVSFKVSNVGAAQLTGYVRMLKHLLKPPTINNDLWNYVWNNVEYCLGPDDASMRKRITSILEVVNKKSMVRFGLVEVINQLSLIADGRIAASILLQQADVHKTDSKLAQPLIFERLYPTPLSARLRSGPMGRGWIVPHLEIRLLPRKSGDVFLEKDRAAYSFVQNGDVLLSANLPYDYILETGTHYSYITQNLYYNFTKDTGRLLSFGVVGTEQFTTITYTFNRATQLVAWTGSKINIIYNSRKLIQYVSLLNAAGVLSSETSYTYTDDNLLATVRRGSEMTKYEYNVEGDLSAVQYPLNTRQEITYNPTTRWFTGVSLFKDDIFISSTDFNMDCDGKLDVITQPENLTSNFWFGFGGVLVEKATPSSLPLSVIYDPVSKQEELQVGDVTVAVRSFDPDTGISIQTDANGDTLERLLSEDGDILRASTSLGLLYETNISNGQLHAVTFADGTREVYKYSNVGRISQRILRDSTDIMYQFDNADNLIQTTGNRGSKFYTYNSDGNINEIQSSDGITTIEYDNQGLPTAVIYPSGEELRYTYNEANLRTSLTTNTGYKMYYNYDSHYRLLSVSDGDGTILSEFTYGTNGNLEKCETGSGVYTEYKLEDGSLQLSELNISKADGTPISRYAYHHDHQGYRVSTDTKDGPWNYKYDAAGQLIMWESPFGHGEEITYDANLNRITKTTKGRAPTIYGKNKLGQVESFGSNEEMSYDRNGHLREKKVSQGNKENYEIFGFDQEGRLTLTESKGDTNNRCEYLYDGFGSISKQTCADGTVTSYLVDPFGPYGANVIAESGADNINFMYYANDLGLVAEKAEHGFVYFLYDGDGTVVHTANASGSVSDGYTYDPFGVPLSANAKTNKFGFLGLFGNMRLLEAKNMYSLRARIYDASHGRFISPDPLWPLVQPRNSYTYGLNEPNSHKDPTGEFAQILGGTLIGAVTGALANAALQAFSIGLGGGSYSDFSWSDVGGAAVSGAITGAAVSSGAILGGFSGFGLTFVGGFIGGGAGSITSDALSGKPINYGDMIKSGLLNAPAALVPWKMLGYQGRGAASFANKHMITPKLTTVLDPRRATGKTLWKSLGAGSAIGEIASKLGDLLPDIPPNYGDDLKKWVDGFMDDVSGLYDDLSDDLPDAWDDIKDDVGDWFDDFTDDLSDLADISDTLNDWLDKLEYQLPDWGDDIADWFQDWIQSRDPNDIIGPTGYGDGNFINNEINMDYKIRFENDENATAPAQRVTINCPLVNGLDTQTFRLGSVGFGDFELQLEYTLPIHQQFIDVVEKIGVVVLVQAGIDRVNKQGIWVLQTIDPETGFPPTDPTKGFLPPNNKSTGSGEGFVKFRIKQDADIDHLNRIDAKASIIFDVNAPIETPPIFHTIDRTWPNVTIVVNQELIDSNGIFVTLIVQDTGSGFRHADIFTLTDEGEVKSLLTKVNQTGVTLPLAPGRKHKIIALPTDYAGNRKPLDISDYTEVIYQVNCPNNCSGHGECQDNGQCVCEDSFHDEDCSSDIPLLDPPILDFTSDNGTEDTQIILHLSARPSGALSDGDVLSLQLHGYPTGSIFTRGTELGNRLTLQAEEFGNVIMQPPRDLAGSFDITLTAILIQENKNVTRVGVRTVHITPVTDIPSLDITIGCYTQGETTSLQISAASSDNDGSEIIKVVATLIPDFVRIPDSSIVGGSTDLAPGKFNLAYSFARNGTFVAFSFNIEVTASEMDGGDEQSVSRVAKVEACKVSSATTVSTVSSATIVSTGMYLSIMCLLVIGSLA